MYMCPIPKGFRGRAISMYRSEIFDKKEILCTVLEVCTNEEQCSVVCFFFYGQKDSMQRIFIKKYFLFTVGSVCRVMRFTTGSRIPSRIFESRR
jgi:hypothetical protein